MLIVGPCTTQWGDNQGEMRNLGISLKTRRAFIGVVYLGGSATHVIMSKSRFPVPMKIAP